MTVLKLSCHWYKTLIFKLNINLHTENIPLNNNNNNLYKIKRLFLLATESLENCKMRQ